jgi:hypothetical protein
VGWESGLLSSALRPVSLRYHGATPLPRRGIWAMVATAVGAYQCRNGPQTCYGTLTCSVGPTTLGRNDLRCTTYGSQGLCAPNSRVVASKRERMMCSFQLLHTASETRNGSLSHDHGTFGNTKVGRRQRLVHYINAETAPTTTMEHVHPSAYTCPPSTASSSPSPSSSLSHSHFSPGHALSGTHLLPVLP